MTLKKLYKYMRPDGGITVSPVERDGVEYSEMVRLIADVGCVLTDGKETMVCVDVEVSEAGNYTEIGE